MGSLMGKAVEATVLILVVLEKCDQAIM